MSLPLCKLACQPSLHTVPLNDSERCLHTEYSSFIRCSGRESRCPNFRFRRFPASGVSRYGAWVENFLARFENQEGFWEESPVPLLQSPVHEGNVGNLYGNYLLIRIRVV